MIPIQIISILHQLKKRSMNVGEGGGKQSHHFRGAPPPCGKIIVLIQGCTNPNFLAYSHIQE